MSRIEEDISMLESLVSGVQWLHGGFQLNFWEISVFFRLCN